MTQEANNKTVKTGMITGAILTPVLFLVLYLLLPVFESEPGLANRMKLGLECLVFPGTFLLIVIIRVGSQRYGNPSENPVKVVASNKSMEIDLRVLSNTLEQVTVFAINTMALSVLLPYSYLSLLPVYSAIFVLGRITFWLAYRHNELWRAPGFAMGVLPAAAGLVYCCIALILRALSFI